MTNCPKTIPIKKIVQENAGVKTFIFDYSLDSTPGQFVNVWIPRLDEKPFSIANDRDGELWLTICAVGPFSKAMHELKEGDTVGIRGPYGNPFSFEPGSHIATVAGGYGAAPLYFLAKEAKKQGCTVEFFVGARSKEHVLFVDRAEELGVNVHVATDDGSAGYKGYNVPLLAEKMKEGMKVDCMYGCGPELMLHAMMQLSEETGVDAQLSLERYMKCGFGVCGHCCIDPLGLTSCQDGPVFDTKTAKRLSEFGAYHRDKNGKKLYFGKH